MKRQFLFIATAISTLFAVSCAKETQNEPVSPVGLKEVTITASVDAATKTSFDTNGKFSWTKGDQISVLGDNNVFYTFTANESAATSTFTGKVDEGVTLLGQALYPADAKTRKEGNDCYFNIPEYKDLTVVESADVPMGACSEEDTYVFKHMAGAALFTFNKFPANVVAAVVTFTNDYCKLNGEFNASYGDDLIWTYSPQDINPEKTNGVYSRKVKVNNGSAQVYLPYADGGTIWNEINIKVVGVFADGREEVLLNTATATALPQFERAKLQKVTPVALPDYVDLEGVDWNSAVSPEVVEGVSEGKVFADAKYLYVKLLAPSSLDWNAIYCYFGKGIGSVNLSWGWGTAVASVYELEGSYENGVISLAGAKTLVKIDGENEYYYMAFPRNADPVLSASGEIYMGMLFYYYAADGSESVPATFPKTWEGENCALKITLP